MTDFAYPFEPGDTLSAAALNAAIALGQSNVWRSGAGAPSDAVGKDGDMYLNTTISDVYQRSAGHYAIITNIAGQPGPPGPVTPGPPGPPGASSGGTVSNIATTGPGISGGPISTTGSLQVQWNAGVVTAIDAATLSAAGGTLKVTAAGSGGAPTGAAGGDLSGSYPNPTLAASGVTPGLYGDGTHVPVVTVDATGRVTMMGVVTLTPAPASFATITGTATFAQLPASVQQVPVTFGFSGKPASGAVANAPVAMSLVVPASLAGATVYCSTKTTVNAGFVINRITGGSTITPIGTVTITSASNVSANLSGSGATMAVGDVLQCVAPAQDATLSDCAITLLAART